MAAEWLIQMGQTSVVHEPSQLELLTRAQRTYGCHEPSLIALSPQAWAFSRVIIIHTCRLVAIS